MALKKSQLYSSLWQSCDELRGGMDASQYKDYVLTLLFMKHVSDKYAGDSYALIEVPPGGSFADMVKLKGDKEIGDKINKIIGQFAEANDLKGVIDQADFNDESKLGAGKEMQDRLSKLVAIFEGLDFRANRAEGDDLLGDAYEYLMRTESGKSKGQFYTPAEVSRIMAKVIGIGPDTQQDQTIYDPTCGSGSLLLKAADEAPHGITVYGQEMNNATYAMARMNMILHGHETAELWCGNTLVAPYFKNPDGRLKTFDFAVANPPFSTSGWSNSLDPANDEFGRFVYGIPPTKNGDYAFLLHLIASLNSKGKGAIILPHGVLFRGNKEADIRKNLIRQGFIKGIIGLPANLLYGIGIPVCILVFDKENAQARTGIFIIDASKGFLKDGNKNRLRAQDLHRIVDVFNKQTELPRYSRMVPLAEIASPANDYNLNIPRYIDSSEPKGLSMNWSLEHYNLICYGDPSPDIFQHSSGNSTFPAERLFEYTSTDVENRFKENVGDLSELPALVVAEVANPLGEPYTPAFFTQLSDVQRIGSTIRFSYKHLTKALSSEEVFGGELFDTEDWEHSRTHWAVKKGNLVSKLFELLAGRRDHNLPKLFDIETWPLPRLDHVAVMMPFSAEFDPVYNVIKTVCEEAGCPALRVDEIYGPTKIINDVFSTIVQSRLVVCDLTGKNPNVLYETGLAHALGRDVILLTQNKEDIPFDLQQIRFISYVRNNEGLESLRDDLKWSLNAALDEH